MTEFLITSAATDIHYPPVIMAASHTLLTIPSVTQPSGMTLLKQRANG